MAAHEDQAPLEVLENYKCPITLQLMRDPVMLETGQTYERSAITKWLARGESTGVLTCPKSRLPLKTKTLTINWSLRAVIQDWWNEHAIEVRKDEISQVESLVPGQPSNTQDRITVEDFKTIFRLVTSGAAGAINVGCRAVDRLIQRLRGRDPLDLLYIAPAALLLNVLLKVYGKPAEGASLALATLGGGGMDPAVSPSRQPDSAALGTLEMDALEPLVVLLRQGTAHVKMAVVETLSTFARSGHDWRIWAAGATVPLANFVQNGAPAESALAGGLLARLVLDAALSAGSSLVVLGRLAIRPLLRLVALGGFPEIDLAMETLNRLSKSPTAAALFTSREALKQLLEALEQSPGRLKARQGCLDLLYTLATSDAHKASLVEGGVLFPLVRLLREGSTFEITFSAKILLHLAILVDNISKIVGAGALEPLIAHLITGTAEEQFFSAGALANLARLSKYRPVIVEKGAVPSLVRLLGIGIRAAENSAVAITNLAQSASLRMGIVKEGAVESLVRLLGSLDPQTRIRGAIALDVLGQGSDIIRGRISAAGGVPPLTRMLGDGDDAKLTAVTMLLSFSLDHGNQTAMLAEGAVKLLVSMLKQGTASAKARATAVLTNLARDSASVKVSIISCGAIPLLVENAKPAGDRLREIEAERLLLWLGHPLESSLKRKRGDED